MTIEQVIGQVDTLKPNSYSDEEKRIWLKRLEQRIILEIVNTHEPEPPKNNFGDAYCDGEINEDDIALIKVFAGKNAVPTEKSLQLPMVTVTERLRLLMQTLSANISPVNWMNSL